MDSPVRWAANVIVAIVVATAVWSISTLVPADGTREPVPSRPAAAACTVHAPLQYAHCGPRG